MDSNGSQPSRAPVHVAIIMDGNGRWARRRGLPRTAGHRRGAEAVRRVVESALASGVSYLTLYGFSSENWKRPAQEVDALMALLRRYLRSETAELHKHNVRLRFIGDRTPFAPDIIALIEQAEAQTRDNTALDLIVALNYGGRGEITGAARKLAERAQRGELEPAAVTEESFAACLSTSGIPDPDLVIRTSGEKRLSNFLLWQLAYAELVFVDTLWPDFGKDDFENVIREYHRRERRYGAAGR